MVGNVACRLPHEQVSIRISLTRGQEYIAVMPGPVSGLPTSCCFDLFRQVLSSLRMEIA